MPLNPDAVGSQSEPNEVSWTSDDTLLYAVSLGCGTGELQYATENTNGVSQQVLPTFPVVLGWGASVMSSVGTFNRAMQVHASQSVTLHQVLPVAGRATVVSKVVAMYDKGKAGIVAVETAATDDTGAPLYTTGMSSFIRGEGGWGGDRGPSGAQHATPDRRPDHSTTYVTSPDQALLYRLNGDRNPLHSDPSFAAMGGFERPILHGLCTFGFTARALLHALCGGESSRVRHIEGRFASPVIPGEALTVDAWVVGEGEALFTTSVGDRVVIDQGSLRFDS